MVVFAHSSFLNYSLLLQRELGGIGRLLRPRHAGQVGHVKQPLLLKRLIEVPCYSYRHLYSIRSDLAFTEECTVRSSTEEPKKGTPWLKGSSSKELEKPYEELNLKSFQDKFGSIRVRQHANPLKAALRVIKVPDWSSVFSNPNRPLMVDIGSGLGRFLLLLSHRDQGGQNFLGLEIRRQLVERSNSWAQELGLTNVHFVVANATLGLDEILASYPGPLVYVTILCPDPHFKKRHHKRRVVQETLVTTLAKYLVPGGKVFVQSDVEELALNMRQQFLDHGGDHFDLSSEHNDPSRVDEQGWLLENPLGVPTEREVHVILKNGYVYRLLYVRK